MTILADGFTANATIVEALACSKRGWHVLPVMGKRPLTQHGFMDATTDAGLIEQWYTRWPDAGIGIRTGAESNILVLDFDKMSGGIESMHDLERKYGKLPDTVTALSGGGGMHLYYQHPGFEVKPSAGQLADGVDVRCDSAYIVAPPSIHKSGKRYAWELSSHPDDNEPEHAPEWLLDLLNEKRKVAALPRSFVPIPSGNRNNELTRYAGRFATFGHTEEELYGILKVINQSRCEEPLPDKELSKIARSAARWIPEQPISSPTLVNVPLGDKLSHRENNHSNTHNTVVNPLGDKLSSGLSETAKLEHALATVQTNYRDTASKQSQYHRLRTAQNRTIRKCANVLIAITNEAEYQDKLEQRARLSNYLIEQELPADADSYYLMRQAGLAERAGCSGKTVQRHRADLESYGLIESYIHERKLPQVDVDTGELITNPRTGEVLSYRYTDLWVRLYGSPAEVLERAAAIPKDATPKPQPIPFVPEVQKDHALELATASRSY